MKRRDDDSLDAVLRARAHAAHDEHAASINALATEDALQAVRARIDGGEVPTMVRAEFRPQRQQQRQRQGQRQLLMVAAAVLLLAVVGTGLVALGTRDQRPAEEAATSAAAPTTSSPVSPSSSPSSAPSTTPGTVLVATTLPATTVTTTTSVVDPLLPPGEVLPITYRCADEFTCTQLASTEDGRLVVFDPVDNAMVVYDAIGQVIETTVPLAMSLAGQFPLLGHIGPDDVAYFSVVPPGVNDPVSDLIAIPLRGPSAGAVVARYTGLDGSGDSELAPQAAGFATVGCCEPLAARPAPDAAVYPYVDSNGAPITSAAPHFRLDLGESGNRVVRIDDSSEGVVFALPSALAAPRGMPELVATADGGALALDVLYGSTQTFGVIARFNRDWPENDVDNSDVFFVPVPQGQPDAGVVLLERTGTVIVLSGSSYVRATLEDVATRGWPGRVVVDSATGAVAVSGLDAYIAEARPDWARYADTLALQLVQVVGPNESLTWEYDETTGVLTVTTSGFLDDSVAASRITAQTSRDADGLLRITSATYGVRCQLERGHQDFSVELCV
jgi:hypothetical protein